MKRKFTPKIVLVVGRKNSGKTTYLQQVLRRARQCGLKVGGILSPGKWEKNTQKEYSIVDVRTGRQIRLAWLANGQSSSIRAGAYAFSRRAFQVANQVLRESRNAEVVVVDEYGLLEKNGSGFRPALKYLLENYSGILFIALRPSLLHQFRSELKSGL